MLRDPFHSLEPVIEVLAADGSVERVEVERENPYACELRDFAAAVAGEHEPRAGPGRRRRAGAGDRRAVCQRGPSGPGLGLRTVGVTTAKTAEPPVGLAALAQRYDPDAIDVPGGRGLVRLRVGSEEWDARLTTRRMRLVPARPDDEPDASIAADAATWRAVAKDVRGGMAAFQKGRLRMRGSLHLGVGLLAATSGSDEPGRLSFETLPTRSGRISILSAGSGPVVLAIHGLGGSKASFLPTIGALADAYRVVAVDLPGFGDSASRCGRPTTRLVRRRDGRAARRARRRVAYVVGNSMGGRIGIEMALRAARVDRLVLLPRRWRGCARAAGRRWPMLRPELSLLPDGPRPVVEPVVRRMVRRPTAGPPPGWTSSSAPTETPRGRAAFNAARATSTSTSRTATTACGRGWPASSTSAVRVGPQGHPRADRLHEARRATLPRPATGARVRPRAPAGTPARDARGDAGLPGEPLGRPLASPLGGERNVLQLFPRRTFLSSVCRSGRRSRRGPLPERDRVRRSNRPAAVEAAEDVVGAGGVAGPGRRAAHEAGELLEGAALADSDGAGRRAGRRPGAAARAVRAALVACGVGGSTLARPSANAPPASARQTSAALHHIHQRRT